MSDPTCEHGSMWCPICDDADDECTGSPWCACDTCAEGPPDDEWISRAYEDDRCWGATTPRPVDTGPVR